jgi:hypothetical protein
LTFPDAIAPERPTGLTATPGPNAGELTLAWQPNPESDGVLIYEIWRDPPLAGDPTLAGTAVLPSFVDVRSRGGRLARYFVVAVDGGGNRSAPSVVIWGRTR